MSPRSASADSRGAAANPRSDERDPLLPSCAQALAPLRPGALACALPAYTTTGLIAYLGNKRALLPELKRLFLELVADQPTVSFLDPFAGSGGPARLARSLGWEVAASDAENYSYILNLCWLGATKDESSSYFREEAGLDSVFARLNALHPERENLALEHEPYFARHYAPESTANADWRRERLFYTSENALFLDRVRRAIDMLRPPEDRPNELGPATVERALLLGPLVYEAATHANTSGVFKAFHKGFGGHGKDALSRILKPMFLERPLLWPGKPARIARSDAAAFCLGKSVDLCYLDPPYNQHQYGSNYHLLNSLVAAEYPTVDERRDSDGSLASKAGISPNWTQSRSAFCSRPKALRAFAELFASIDSRHIVLSYNDEGFAAADELYDLLAERAEVEVRSLEYLRYRGGRQSAERTIRNSELLFIARRRERLGRAASFARQRSEALAELDAKLALRRALSAPLDPEKVRLLPLWSADENEVSEDFGPLARESDYLVYRAGKAKVRIPSFFFLECGAPEGLDSLSSRGMADLARRLAKLAACDNVSAGLAAARLIEEGQCDPRLQALALRWLRKIAYVKYGEAFRSAKARLEAVSKGRETSLATLIRGLSTVGKLYYARTEGRKKR